MTSSGRAIIVVTNIPRVVHPGTRIKMIDSNIVFVGRGGVWYVDTRPWHYDELDWDEIRTERSLLSIDLPSHASPNSRTAFAIVTAINLAFISLCAWFLLVHGGLLGVFACYFCWDAAISISKDARTILQED